MRIFFLFVSSRCLKNLLTRMDQVQRVLPTLSNCGGILEAIGTTRIIAKILSTKIGYLSINNTPNAIARTLGSSMKETYNPPFFIIAMQQDSTGQVQGIETTEEQSAQQGGQSIFSPFKQQPREIQVYPFQVSGKTPKYIDNALGFIYKNYSSAEHQFYLRLNQLNTNDDAYPLKKFIPPFFGLETADELGSIPAFRKESNGSSNRNEWIDHITSRKAENDKEKKQFLCLKNMTYGYEVPSIMDLKLGIKKSKKSNAKFAISSTNTYKFRINGEMVALKKQSIYEQHFVSKYFGQSISVDQTEIYLALFFFNGTQINLPLLTKVIEELRELILCFKKCKGIRFISSSLFIAYDSASPHKCTVNLIDFDRYESSTEQEDTVVCEGLMNIHSFFQAIIAHRDELENRLRKRQLEIFKEEGRRVVPQHILQKYSK